MCGENLKWMAFQIRVIGTPPRVWGKRNLSLKLLLNYRYTPTCVGKTVLAILAWAALIGTPPRVWGKPDRAWKIGDRTRYTPTCVGKTTSTPFSILPSKVHPHVCGENFCAILSRSSNSGTPPRVWGKRLSLCYRPIPSAVHPHVCGENKNVLMGFCASIRYTPTCVGKTGPDAIEKVVFVGTPPRVWGKLSSSLCTAPNSRYTPTCVGKTPFRSE